MAKIDEFDNSLFEENQNKNQYTQKLPLNDNDVLQAKMVTESRGPFTGAYRCNASSEHIVSRAHKGLSTYQELVENAVSLFGERPCLSYRPFDYGSKTSKREYVSISYNEMGSRRLDLGSGILYLLSNNPFLRPECESHDKIKNHAKYYKSYSVRNCSEEKNISFVLCINSPNRMEWVLTDLACSSYSITNSALYDSLNEETGAFILSLTRSPIIVCPIDKVSSVIYLKKKYPERLKCFISVVSMDNLRKDDPLVAEAEKVQIQLQDFSTVEKIGRKHRTKPLPPNPDTLYTISFTSGSTGLPKGAMLSQRAIVSAITFLMTNTPQVKGGRAFVFLPLSHIFERQTSGFALATGYNLGFPQLTVGIEPKLIKAFENAVEDMRLFKPTYVSMVPRILNRLSVIAQEFIEKEDYSKKMNGLVEKKLSKLIQLDGATGALPEYDSSQFVRRLRDLVGFDELQWVQTASAPIAAEVVQYMKASFNIGVRQLYGLTETFGAFSASSIHDAEGKNSGCPGVTSELRIRAEPDLGYTLEAMKGEICVRSPQVFIGYFGNREATEECLDPNLWFNTGDIGFIDKKGRISVIDRLKNFFKMAQGEYISPEKVENIYLAENPEIAQVLVHGDSLRRYLVGIVGLNYEEGLKFLKEENIFSDRARPDIILAIFNKLEVKERFLRKINLKARTKLSGLEMLHNVKFYFQPMSVENSLLTPTLKTKRANAGKHFRTVFDELYDIEGSLLYKSKL